MENVTDTNEEIKRMAAFFAQQAYNEPILGHYVEYNNQEYIRIVSSHNNNSGFDGDVYLNTNTKQIIVTFRGTEFGISEQGYLDAIKADVMDFGSGSVPAQYYDAKVLLNEAITILNNGEYYSSATGETYTFSSNPSNLMIVGHSLGGGLAQLVGAQEEYKNYRVETFNAVGAKEIIERNPGVFNEATDHSNITNHVITRDYVSTIFDQIGTTKIYKPADSFQLSSSDFLNLNFLKLGENKTYPVFSALSKIKNAHTILNFTDSTSFQPADNDYTYQSLVSIIRKYEGESILIDDLAPILIPLIKIGFDIAYTSSKVYKRIFRSGSPTGAAAMIESSRSVIQGGISFIDIEDEVVDVCK